MVEGEVGSWGIVIKGRVQWHWEESLSKKGFPSPFLDSINGIMMRMGRMVLLHCDDWQWGRGGGGGKITGEWWQQHSHCICCQWADKTPYLTFCKFSVEL